MSKKKKQSKKIRNRYGTSTLKELIDKGVTEIFLAPLYPHYAMSSFETVVVKAEEILAEKYPEVKLDVLPPFYNKPDYIEVLSNLENGAEIIKEGARSVKDGQKIKIAKS